MNGCLAKVSKTEMKNAAEDVRKLGCAPSLNLQSSGADLENINAANLLLRSAGGHIHIGGLSEYRNDVRTTFLHDKAPHIIMMMDYLCGLTSVIMNPSTEERARRKYYGRAGECRMPKHGLEYRTLSNFWTRHPAMASLMMTMARTAVHIVTIEAHFEIYDMIDNDEAVRAINEVDPKAARKMVKPIYEYISGMYRDWGRMDDFASPFAGTQGLQVTVGFIESCADMLKVQEGFLQYWNNDYAHIGEFTYALSDQFNRTFNSNVKMYG